ncbi:hypothetical protein OIDMADRAFT_138453, partial [Oidiodendron maius Zn]
SEKVDLIATSQLKCSEIFIRNIIYFFNSQEDSVVDSDNTKARKKLIYERYKHICNLSYNGIILWAATFIPTI